MGSAHVGEELPEWKAFREACARARELLRLCELAGVEDEAVSRMGIVATGNMIFLEELRSAALGFLAAFGEDPDDRPYLWDIDPGGD